jgi:enoyl-CoA hydratase
VHEVVEPGELLPAAVDRARQLAQTPAEVYALSKEQLHRPARERIVADRLVDDPKVLEQWSAPSTFSRLREYLDELGRR